MADGKNKDKDASQQDLASQGSDRNRQGSVPTTQAEQAAGADGSRQSGFLHSSPDANVFPAGKRQADNSTRGGGGDSAAGTPDESRMGGSGGTSAPGTTGNDPDR